MDETRLDKQPVTLPAASRVGNSAACAEAVLRDLAQNSPHIESSSSPGTMPRWLARLRTRKPYPRTHADRTVPRITPGIPRGYTDGSGDSVDYAAVDAALRRSADAEGGIKRNDNGSEEHGPHSRKGVCRSVALPVVHGQVGFLVRKQTRVHLCPGEFPYNHFMLTFHQAALLFGIAVVSGAMNAVAGGGSFLSFPALLLVGVPPIQANATNTLALWPGILGSVGAYRNELRGPEARRVLFPLLATSLVGGLLGAVTLLITPPTTFLHLIPYLLLAATLLFAFSSKITSALKPHGGEAALSTKGGAAAQFFVAFYIGYFGAGAGILMMALLALLGMTHIHRINAYKTVQNATCNGIAILAFIAKGVIYWKHAGIMVLGSMLGGYYAAHYAQRMKQEHVRWIVIAIGFGMTAYFFWKQR